MGAASMVAAIRVEYPVFRTKMSYIKHVKSTHATTDSETCSSSHGSCSSLDALDSSPASVEPPSNSPVQDGSSSPKRASLSKDSLVFSKEATQQESSNTSFRLHIIEDWLDVFSSYSSPSSSTSISCVDERPTVKDRESEWVIANEHRQLRTGLCGGFGTIVKARQRGCTEEIACKIQKDHYYGYNEVAVLSAASPHPHIVQYIGTCFNAVTRRHYILMEYMSGGDLLALTIAKGMLPPQSAQKYASEIMDAVQHIHSLQICHRDIKLDNIMIDTAADSVKLIDFGLALTVKYAETDEPAHEDLTTEVVGSSNYKPPEVLHGSAYNPYRADMWSFGVCTFAMLMGFFPFGKASFSDECFRAMRSAQTLEVSSITAIVRHYGVKINAPIPISALQLMDSLLMIDPSERPTSFNLAGNPWLSECHIEAAPATDDPLAVPTTSLQEDVFAVNLLEANDKLSPSSTTSPSGTDMDVASTRIDQLALIFV